MKNDYTLSEDGKTITVWVKYKSQTLACLADATDLDKLKTLNTTWVPSWDAKGRCFYVLCRTKGKETGKRRTLSMHRFLMDEPEGLHVDHRNHITTDNRRSNLRVGTRSQNMMNRKGAFRTSKTGHRGICPHRGTRKLVLQLTINGKRKYIGSFSTIEQAIAARNAFSEYAAMI